MKKYINSLLLHLQPSSSLLLPLPNSLFLKKDISRRIHRTLRATHHLLRAQKRIESLGRTSDRARETRFREGFQGPVFLLLGRVAVLRFLVVFS